MTHLLQTMIFCVLIVLPCLTNTARAQSVNNSGDFATLQGCPRPADAKDVKVVDFDPVTAVARLAVNLGSSRYKVAAIKAWDRPEDPRPLIPVIEAARIMQGNLQFFTPNFNTDPESVHDSFVLRAEMGGGYVCWATPASLLNEGAYPIAQESKANTSESKAANTSALPEPRSGDPGFVQLRRRPSARIRSPRRSVE